MRLVVDYDPPGERCRNRLLEWLTAWMMIGIGATLLTFPFSADNTSFRFLLHTIHPDWLSPFFMLFGIGRMLALNANGMWPRWGTKIRAGGCIFGSAMWAQMGVALAIAASQTGQLSTGVPVYIALSAGEFLSFYRVLRDARRYH